MKAHIILITLIIAFISLHANSKINEQTQMQKVLVQEAINNIYDDFRANTFTCINVVKLGKGSVSKAQCEKQLKAANEKCAKLAQKNVISFSKEEDAHNLMQILITCPVAHMLGHEYQIKDGKAIYKMQTLQ